MCPVCERGQPEDLRVGVGVAGADGGGDVPGPAAAGGQPRLRQGEKAPAGAAHLAPAPRCWIRSRPEVSALAVEGE